MDINEINQRFKDLEYFFVAQDEHGKSVRYSDKKHSDISKIKLPIYHDDGDMIDVYLQDIPGNDKFIRICDFGMAAIKLAASFDLASPQNIAVFNAIRKDAGLKNDNGNLYMEVSKVGLFKNIMKFVGGVQKISAMKSIVEFVD